MRIRQILELGPKWKAKMIEDQYAPIVIFAYNRPDKLNNLLESLSRNKEINSSNLYFYIDHYKNKEDLK